MDVNDLSEAMHGCDTVVHMAALLGVEKTEKRRMECLNINIQGTINLLNLAAQESVKKFIFMSSSEVYGDQVEIPIKETNPLNPKSIYAITKLAGEEYVKCFGERYGMKTTIFRLFNIYGANQVGQFVMSRFVQAVQNDKSPVLFQKGDQVRAFCYVTDAARGIVQAVVTDRAAGETIHLGNPTEPVTMKELADRVISISGKTHIKPEFVSFDKADRKAERDIQKRIPSIEKAKRLLEYEPKISLNEGIKLVMEQKETPATWTDHRRSQQKIKSTP
jgi:UDP-glucose 4-epimerase